MGEPAIISIVFLVLGVSAGCTGWFTSAWQRRERAARTREWIAYLQDDLVA